MFRNVSETPEYVVRNITSGIYSRAGILRACLQCFVGDGVGVGGGFIPNVEYVRHFLVLKDRKINPTQGGSDSESWHSGKSSCRHCRGRPAVRAGAAPKNQLY